MLPLPQDLQFKVAEFVTGRLPLANVREVRPGRRSYVRFAPHEDRAASFLVSAGARVDERLVRELAVHHSVVAVVADAPSSASEAEPRPLAVYQEFSGESTNRTLTSINVLVAFDLGASLAVRLCSRFTRNCLTYRFSGKLRKRFYEDASLESVHLRKARRQRAVAQTEAKLERVLASMKSEAAFIERMERTLAREQEADIGAASIVFGAVVLQSAWRTHKARLRAQWRGIRSRSEIRHLRLVNIVAEGCIASGVIQRKWHRYRARRDALEARAKKSRGPRPCGRARTSPSSGTPAAAAASGRRHQASMAQSMANLAKTDAEQREKARKTLKSPGSSALMQRTAIQSLTFVRAPAPGGALRAVGAPIIDMTPITASDLILTPATGEAANYAPPPPPFISAEFFDLLNPEEIESLEMMRKLREESREETLRSGASLRALNFSGRGGLRPGGGRRMSASGLSLSEGGAGGAPKASAPPEGSVTVDQLKIWKKRPGVWPTPS
ncbi:hypothetical protein JL721_3001 [Aureococcus anophagefferens]|nr:hypothetical protein JL721_3001 [Aureococcus anophagefferens]